PLRAESPVAGLRDRRARHRPRDALATVVAGDAKPLVPHETWRVRTQPLQADHEAFDLRGLKLSARIRHPAIEDSGDVVAALPDVFGDLDGAVAVGGPHRRQSQLWGLQWATPESTMAPSNTSSYPVRRGLRARPARPAT